MARIKKVLPPTDLSRQSRRPAERPQGILAMGAEEVSVLKVLQPGPLLSEEGMSTMGEMVATLRASSESWRSERRSSLMGAVNSYQSTAAVPPRKGRGPMSRLLDRQRTESSIHGSRASMLVIPE